MWEVWSVKRGVESVKCGVANHIEIMETMENLRKHRPRSGGTSDPNLEVQANQIWRYKRTPARFEGWQTAA